MGTRMKTSIRAVCLLLCSIILVNGCRSNSALVQPTATIIDSVSNFTSVSFRLVGISEQIRRVNDFSDDQTGRSAHTVDTISNSVSVSQEPNQGAAKFAQRGDSLFVSWKVSGTDDLKYTFIDTSYSIVLALDGSGNGVRSILVVLSSDYMRGAPHGSLGGDQGSGLDSIRLDAVPHGWIGGAFTIDLQGPALGSLLKSASHRAYIDGGNHFQGYTTRESLIGQVNASADSTRLRLILK